MESQARATRCVLAACGGVRRHRMRWVFVRNVQFKIEQATRRGVAVCGGFSPQHAALMRQHRTLLSIQNTCIPIIPITRRGENACVRYIRFEKNILINIFTNYLLFKNV
jgi:hypothetical protein